MPSETETTREGRLDDAEIASLKEWLAQWGGDGVPNWSDARGQTVPIAKSTLRALLAMATRPVCYEPDCPNTGVVYDGTGWYCQAHNPIPDRLALRAWEIPAWSGCPACPFEHCEPDGRRVCVAPDNGMGLPRPTNDAVEPPSWRPLRERPTLVRLEVRDAR